MSEKRNIGIGILLGAVLTGLLMFVLYQQAGLPEVAAAAPVKDVTTQQTAIVPKTPFASPSAKLKQALPVSTPSPVAVEAVVEVVDAAVQGDNNSTLPNVNLPEPVLLSTKELQGLSAAERTEYEKMLSTYRDMRTQIVQLEQEREQLKQRVDNMFQENDAIEQELHQLREAIDKPAGQ